MKTRMIAVISAICVASAACGAVDDAKEQAQGTEAPSVDELKEKVYAAVVDKLDCSGLVRQETRELVTQALDAGEVDLERLAVSPTELARIVAAAAITTDSGVLLWGNVAQVLRQGHLASAVSDDWSSLNCAESTPFECEDALTGQVAGEGLTSVVCEGGEPVAVRAEFSGGCRVFGTENAGALELSRDATVTFDEFTLGSVRQIHGSLSVEAETGQINRIEIDPGEQLTVSSNAGKSCEQTLTLRSLVAQDIGERTTIEIDAERLADGKTVAVKTLDGPVGWQESASCSCPTSGSVELRTTDLLGQGEQGTLRLHYAPGQSERCSQVSAEIVSWPEQCEEVADCGRDTVERLAGSLVTAACAGHQF